MRYLVALTVALVAQTGAAAPDGGTGDAWEFDGHWWRPRREAADRIDDAALKALVARGQREHVTWLTLSGWGALPAVTPEGWQQLGKLAELQRLDLGPVNLSAQGLAAIAKLPALEVLGMWKQPWTAAQLAPLSAAPRLAELDLKEMPGLKDEPLPPMAHLRTLGLSGTAVGPKTIASLAEGSPLLESLDVSSTALEPKHLVPLAGLPHLKEVSVMFTHARDKDLCALAALKSLRELWVSGSRVRATSEVKCLPGVQLYNHLGE